MNPPIDFDCAVCINLARRPDRWQRFTDNVAAVGWPFLLPDRFDAVDGEATPSPPEWKHGPGAWGCLRSHAAVLAEAAADGVGSVLVMEDDATFGPTFAADARAFGADVRAFDPAWDLLFLGGNHLCTPEPVAPGVLRCRWTGRTHAYAVSGRCLPDLAALLAGTTDRADAAMWPWGQGRRVYAPERWLAGQAAGPSDIEGREHVHDRWWQQLQETRP